ncbi:XrtA/PEP-CTERM system-associated ATPase [Novosphingobium pentaromativorans]|uniref:ATPase n=1 Tax=Novosphingobium pentaromativorans US6-1 TaxID=1088721 RepID=G6E7P6_9SPHN|nr:XrtA/PEP-CTERM system-associated ATPase [Novosphingobium pentaromativorans]AIT81726.1 general secretion pathway protein [Novosphingobium pentaromativorans US6-1]EHJ62688.1 ATPase [Novosphingobium pentaromativorans US6-1]
MFDDFYGFESRPFQLTPDPAFYFESRTHRKALSYLGYGLAQGEGFVVITGEVGAGKSTLVAHLMATIDPSRLTAAQVVTSALDGEEIVHVVAQAFGLAVAGHDKASALGAIEGFLHEEARQGRRCLLIVDEAQNLTVSALEELRMLSNFQLGSHPLLQTLLLGQPEFRSTLLESGELEQLRQRVIATHHLEAMQADEVQAYIEHRLGCVGWQGNPQFDAQVFAGIFDATGGVPRRINQLVNRLLLLGAVEQRCVIDGEVLDQVLAELDADGSISLVSRKAAEPEAEPEAAAMQGEAAEPAVSPRGEEARTETVPGGIDSDEVAAIIEAAMADRDAQITELQQAVLELAMAAEAREHEAADAGQAQVASLEAQLQAMSGHVSDLEARLAEHDRMLRHTLTMLIEWIEGGEGQRRAA